MSTQTTARGIVGSLRLVAMTAALAVGSAGFGTVAGPAAAAPHVQLTEAAQASARVELRQGQVPSKACDAMAKARVPASVSVELGCTVIGDSGPITGGPLL